MFEELVEKGLAEGVTTQEAYKTLVSDFIEQKRRWGGVDDDNDLEGMEDKLEGRWSEYQAALEKNAK